MQSEGWRCNRCGGPLLEGQNDKTIVMACALHGPVAFKGIGPVPMGKPWWLSPQEGKG